MNKCSVLIIVLGSAFIQNYWYDLLEIVNVSKWHFNRHFNSKPFTKQNIKDLGK